MNVSNCLWRVSLILLVFVPDTWAASETAFVQAVKTPLKSEPQLSAASVAEVSRGTQLVVLSKSDPWIRVRVVGTKNEGWISKLFVSAHRPIGRAELLQQSAPSLEKSTRQRSPSYSVAASARGLLTDVRTRSNREKYLSDYQSLERLERYPISNAALDKFENAAKLKP